jgi:hypothetical protein
VPILFALSSKRNDNNGRLREGFRMPAGRDRWAGD